MKKETKTVRESEKELIASDEKEFNLWLGTLQTYHTERFDKNYRQYTTYTQTKGTHAKISDPVAPELVERVIQKMFTRDPKFSAMARGKAIPRELRKLMEAVAEYTWTCPETVQSTGTMRSKLKQVGREFCVTGQTGVETYYNGEAQSPDFRVIPIEDVIFDAATSLRRSKVYYVRQFVSLDYLKSLKEVEKDGKVVSGRFKHVDEIEAMLKGDNKKDSRDGQAQKTDDPSSNQVNRSGSSGFSRPVDNLLMVTRHEGKKFRRIVEWSWVTEEGDDVLGLGEDPLDFAMDIEVPKQPYAFGLIDFINGMIQAKDLLLNQIVDYGSKALNPPLFVDPNLAPANRVTLRNAYKAGGIVFASAQQAQHQPMPALPAAGFDTLNYIQQRSESVTGIGAYLGGVPNQTSDKTKGTKGGIEALMAQASSPLMDRQQNLEESIIEPVINKFLRIQGEMMSDTDPKWVFISGQEQRWVKVAKGILTGKVRLADLVTAGLVETEEGVAIKASLEEAGKDPEKEILFDVDWIVRVETGSMGEIDRQRDLENFDGWVAFNAQFGIPMNLEEISKERAMRSGIKEPDQYLAEQPQGGPAAPAPDPKAQAEAAKIEAETARVRQQTAIEAEKAAIDMQIARANLASAANKAFAPQPEPTRSATGV